MQSNLEMIGWKKIPRTAKVGQGRRTSDIGHRTSEIRYLTSDNTHERSNVGCLTSDNQHPMSDMRHETSDINHQTSQI